MTYRQWIYYPLAAINGGPGFVYLFNGDWFGAAVGIGGGCILVWIGDQSS